MTISTTVRKAGPYTGDGATAIFPFAFKVFATTDIVVTVTDILGNETVASGYTVNLNSNQDNAPGGTVTFMVAPAIGVLVTLTSNVAATQPMSLTNNGNFFPKVLNDAADREVILIQQLNEKVGRALLAPVSSVEPLNGLNIPSAALRAGKILAFDANGVLVTTNSSGATDSGLRTDLASLALGGSLISFSATGAGALAQSVRDKLLQGLPTVRDRIGVGNLLGTTDCRAGFAAADAVGTFRVTPGLYLIASSITILSDVVFDNGARLVIPTGVTVTFKGKIDAGLHQIFNVAGTGAVAGLRATWIEWFANDYKGSPDTLPTVESSYYIGKAASSAIAGGAVNVGVGHWLFDGTTGVAFGEVSFHGAGSGNSVFRFAGAVCNGFTFAPGSLGNGGVVHGFAFTPHVPGTIPTSGNTLTINRTGMNVYDISITDTYIGLWSAGGVSNNYSCMLIAGSVGSGIRCTTIDQYYANIVVTALNDWVTLTGITGAFNVGDSINVAGSVGSIIASYPAYPGRYRMFFNDAEPAAGTAITSSSGGSATIAAVGTQIGHQLGAFRTEGNVEAVTLRAMDCLGGLFGRVATSASGVPGRTGNMSFCSIANDVYFDSPYRGSKCDGEFACEDDGWYANARTIAYAGMTKTLSKASTHSGRYVANSGPGFVVSTGCNDIEFVRPVFDGNCRKTGGAANMADLVVGAATNGFTLIGGRLGFPGANGTTPPFGLLLVPGATNNVTVVAANLAFGTTSNGATGVTQTWMVKGMPMRFGTGDIGNYANDAAASAAGIPVGGFYRNGSALQVRVA